MRIHLAVFAATIATAVCSTARADYTITQGDRAPTYAGHQIDFNSTPSGAIVGDEWLASDGFNIMAGTGDGNQRLKEMDADDIDGEVLYPGVGGVLNITKGIKNNDAYHALISTYNRWLVEEYCAPDPDRLIGVACIPSRGLDEAITELEYAAEAGLKIVALSKFPSGKGYPTPDDDRFWAAALDLDMPITVHVNFPKPEGKVIE